jgi:acetyl-CoA carboxylase biotin carboxyl carrier protein
VELCIQSPLAGVIKEVLVKEGDAVKMGDIVLILESMKMEIPVDSTVAGLVTKVSVAAGSFASQGDTLVVVSGG